MFQWERFRDTCKILHGISELNQSERLPDLTLFCLTDLLSLFNRIAVDTLALQFASTDQHLKASLQSGSADFDGLCLLNIHTQNIQRLFKPG